MSGRDQEPPNVNPLHVINGPTVPLLHARQLLFRLCRGKVAQGRRVNLPSMRLTEVFIGAVNQDWSRLSAAFKFSRADDDSELCFSC